MTNCLCNIRMLYDYQQAMLQRIRVELAKSSGVVGRAGKGTSVTMGRSVMVQMPTGTGKTYLMAAVVKTLAVKGTVWVVAHRRELVAQMEETLCRFGIPFSDGRHVESGQKARVCVMSVQWLSRRLDRCPLPAPGLVIIDEAHHSLAVSYRRLWAAFPSALKLGFTATPCRLRREGFTGLWDTLLTSWSVKTFIQKGRLALYDYVVINQNSEEQRIIDGLEKRGADGDYAVSEMAGRLNSYQNIERLHRSLQTYAGGKKGIVYAINIEHAQCIAAFYQEKGLRAVAVSSRTPAVERAQMVQDFKAGRLDCLVNVNLFDEGFDCPDVEFIQMARPTLSLSKYMQMIGRGLRTHPDKQMCVLIDNVGLYRLFGLPDADRDWEGMFKGLLPGRGCLSRQRRIRCGRTDNDMEIVVNHSHLLLQTEEERTVYFSNSKPFEKNGRWGLRVGEDVILRPVYRYIAPFVGKYSAFELVPGQWGILCRDGSLFVPALFKKIELLPDGDAIIVRNEISRRRVHLDTTFSNRKDVWEWWGEVNVRNGGFYL